MFFHVKTDHGILTEWSSWSPCEEIIDEYNSVRYIQRRTRECHNRWSPDHNGVSCDPDELTHDERECREEFVGMRCFDSDVLDKCCSTEHPCGFKESDCDSDSHCVGELVCGSNNCQQLWPYLQDHYLMRTDCCTLPGKLNISFHSTISKESQLCFR